MDDYDRQMLLLRRAKLASYVLIVLAIMAGTALGALAAKWLWPL
jgi:hypothetical protein